MTLEQLRALLEGEFSALHLEVVDTSSAHVGHAGYRAGEMTHVRITLVTEAFIACPRLARERRVLKLLSPSLARGLHAVSMQLMTPEEFKRCPTLPAMS